MTSLRVIRRVSHGAERVTLGAFAKAPSIAAEVRASERSVAVNDAPERHAKDLADLRARLESVEREREHLKETLAGTLARIESDRESARQEGYREGAARAQREAESTLAEQLAHWRTSTSEAAQGFESRLQAIRPELAHVVLAAVTKLLGEHVVTPLSVRATLEQVLREAGLTGSVRVLVAPAQFDQLSRFGAAQLAALRERKVEVAPDSRVTQGGCLVETPAGLVDGRFEIQLAKLRDIVSGHYAAGGQSR